MLYMVVEHFKRRACHLSAAARERAADARGTRIRFELIDVDLKICWQLMRAEDESLFQRWIDNWKDLMDFEIVPVRTSSEVRELMKNNGREPACSVYPAVVDEEFRS